MGTREPGQTPMFLTADQLPDSPRGGAGTGGGGQGLPQRWGAAGAGGGGAGSAHSGGAAGGAGFRGKPETERVVQGNRERVASPAGKRLQKLRTEKVERSMAHLYETGGMRRLY